MAAEVLSIHAFREQQISCCAMDNQSLNQDDQQEDRVFPIYRTTMRILGLFLAIGLLLFLFNGGWLLILMLFIGDFCC
jgi:uncharacterized membrane protein YjjP (DUF1212 family)